MNQNHLLGAAAGQAYRSVAELARAEGMHPESLKEHLEALEMPLTLIGRRWFLPAHAVQVAIATVRLRRGLAVPRGHLTPAQAAIRLGIATSTVYELTYRGKLRATRYGRFSYVSEASVLEYERTRR